MLLVHWLPEVGTGQDGVEEGTDHGPNNATDVQAAQQMRYRALPGLGQPGQRGRPDKGDGDDHTHQPGNKGMPEDASPIPVTPLLATRQLVSRVASAPEDEKVNQHDSRP